MKGLKISIAELRACAAKGLTADDTAARLGCTRNTVYRLARDFEVTFRRQRKPTPVQIKIISFIRDGVVTAPDIAKRTGWPRSRVSVACFQMDELGFLRRGPKAMRGIMGRPPIRWQLGPALEAAQ